MVLFHDIKPVINDKPNSKTLASPLFLVDDLYHSKEIRRNKSSNLKQSQKTDIYLVKTLPEVEKVWSAFQKTAWHTPFQSFQWINSWHQSQTDVCPAIIVGYEGNAPVFIFPLAVEQKHGVNRLVWLADEVNDYNCPLISRNYLLRMTNQQGAEIWTRISQLLNNIDVYHITKQPEFLAGVRNPFIAKRAVQGSCSSHILTLKKDWKEFYQGLRSPKSQRRVRQKVKKLRRAGKLQFKSPSNLAEWNFAADTILKWKSDQLDCNGDRNPLSENYSDPVDCSTLKQTIKNLGISGNASSMRIYGLYLDNKLVAGIIAFVSHKTFSLFTSAYDATVLPNCSLGLILLIKTFELSARAGMEKYDFLAGDEAYKFDWCNQHLKLYDSFIGTTAIGRLDAAANGQKLAMKKFLKSQPKAMTMLRSINRFKNQARAELNSGGNRLIRMTAITPKKDIL